MKSMIGSQWEIWNLESIIPIVKEWGIVGFEWFSQVNNPFQTLFWNFQKFQFLLYIYFFFDSKEGFSHRRTKDFDLEKNAETWIW